MTKIGKLGMPQSLDELLKIIKQAKAEGAKVEFLEADTGQSGVENLLRSLRETSGGEEAARAIEEALRDGGSEICDDCGEVHGPSGHGSTGKPTAETVHALLDVVGAHQTPPTFKPGNFVRFREHIQYVKRARDIHVVVENISPPVKVRLNDENLSGPFAYRSYDILIATMTGRGICVYYGDAREMELYPQAELDGLLSGKKGAN